MDERRARIHEDLRDLLEGELHTVATRRAAYSVDASIYEVEPLAVVVPRSESDVAVLLKYASEHGIPIHPRGGGTGMAGGCLGPGLVVDFSRHFRRVLDLGEDQVTVQSGVVLDVLNARLLPQGRRIAPDPSTPEARTIGGMVAADSAGPRSLRYGTTADHVLELRAVLSSGEALRLGLEPWPAFDDEPVDLPGVLTRKIANLLRWHADLIRRSMPRSPRNRAGYALSQASRAEGVDLARLVVGSEGTLALVTQATLRTVPLPPATGAVLLPFGRAVDAAAAVVDCLDLAPSACELHDWRSLSLARDRVPGFREWIAEPTESALVVEFESEGREDLTGRIRQAIARVARRGHLVADPVEATRRGDVERLMGLRKAVLPLLMRNRGRTHPVPFLEDVAVPPEALPEFVSRLQSIMRRHEVSWTLYGHAGHGQLHPRPFLDLSDPRHVAKLEPLADETYEAAWDLGGTISGEHGCGLVRTQFLRAQYGAEMLHVFSKVKESFDPQGLLNPGKVVGDDPHLMLKNLRAVPVVPREEDGQEAEIEVLPRVGLIPSNALRWSDGGPAEEASACNGCGACRTQVPTFRMCPTFRALHSEAATPRAKANLIRGIAAGSIDPRLWGTDELRRGADLCIHCNLCKSECPSGVDVSSLMLEAKAAHVENHGLSQADWSLSRIDRWGAIATRLPITTNAVLRNRWARWALERIFGLSRHRSLPKAHRTRFLRRAERLGLCTPRPQAPGPRVAYFVDVFADHFDQELGEAVVGVLQRAGVNVYVPRDQRGSGLSSLVVGDLDHARQLALANLRVLSNAVRDGYTIVCSEPSAAMMLRQEYLKLTDDLDAALVAESTLDIGDYLAGLSRRGLLPDPKLPVRAKVGYHQPCHLRALGVGSPGLDLIRTIPELDVEFIDRGCSGMGGVFGLTRSHFRVSRRAGRPLLRRLRDEDLELGSTECGACRIQMEQGVRKPTLHPIKLLSLSYGLNPSLRQRFKDPKPRHVVL